MQRLWELLRRWPFAALALLTAVQTAGTLSSRALWFSDEVRYADAYAGLLRGKWLVLSLNGVAYPDKPPLYFWLLRALDAVTGIADPAVFFLGAAVSGLLMLYATLAWAKVLRLPGDAGLLAGLALLSTLFFAGLLHYSRMDLLFAALITASQAAFCLAFRPGDEARRGRNAALALFLAALATLTKGPLGLLFPVLTTLLFLAWRGQLRQQVYHHLAAQKRQQRESADSGEPQPGAGVGLGRGGFARGDKPAPEACGKEPAHGQGHGRQHPGQPAGRKGDQVEVPGLGVVEGLGGALEDLLVEYLV